MQTLTVVNQMIGTMGEAPLNTIEDPHTFRGTCLSILDNESRRIQARGWWYNMEEITLSPMTDSRISLPGDLISIRTPTRDVVQRGRFLYDLSGGTPFFASPIACEVIRLVPFESLPESAAQYIAAAAVLKFQSRYDGDRQKTLELEKAEKEARTDCNTEHTRNRRSNFIESNAKLQRLKQTTNGARRFIR